MMDSYIQSGDRSIEQFIEEYQEKRKLAHMRRIKVDKMKELLARKQSATPSRQAPPPPGGYGGGGYEDQLVLLRPPASSRNRGGLGSISELIDIDYETLVLLLGVAGAGASWVLYQTILTKGRRSFKQLKKAEQQDNVLDKVADFLNVGKEITSLCSFHTQTNISDRY